MFACLFTNNVALFLFPWVALLLNDLSRGIELASLHQGCVSALLRAADLWVWMPKDGKWSFPQVAFPRPKIHLRAVFHPCGRDTWQDRNQYRVTVHPNEALMVISTMYPLADMLRLIVTRGTQIARFMGPTWDPPGSCRPQMGPMLAPWTLLSG